MAKKEYSLEVNRRERKARSKRLRELGSGGGASGGSTVVEVSSAPTVSGSSHSHANLSTLDKLSADDADYVYLSQLREGTDDEGNPVWATEREKVKAGYADKAQNLTEDSSDWTTIDKKDSATLDAAKEYTDSTALSKVHDDTAKGVLTIEKRMRSVEGLATPDYDIPGNADNMLGRGFELVKDLVTGRTRLEVDELLVRLKAFFAELEIRRLSYLGGNYVFSSAGSRIYYVEKVADGWKCYFYSDDGSTATMNYWQVGDQARCQTFNLDGTGVHKDVANKYYWRLVTSVGQGRIAGKMLADGSADETEYQWAVLSDTDFDGDGVPEAGDSLVQMGNRNKEERQGFIYLLTEGGSAPAVQIFSGVGAQYPYYRLPEPSVQLSPHGNIIYGEFHSVANGGANIDDLLSGLSAELAEVRDQTDHKYEMWFFAHSPLPTMNDDGENEPASSWQTDEEKALHIQDLFYDIQTEPASSGGRAWRWMLVNGRYCWVPITDQDTLSSLERIANVAGDGVLTGGAEKGRVLVDWLRVVSELKKYHEQATDYLGGEATCGYDIHTPLNAFITAFESLGRLLNNGERLEYDLATGEVNTPAWLVDLQTSTTVSDPAAYRTAWDGYYYALAGLLKAIGSAAKALADHAQASADAAQEVIDEIVSDGVLDASEKQTVKREFVSAWHEKNDEGGLLDQAQDVGGQWLANVLDYESAFLSLGRYLNGEGLSGTRWQEPSILNDTTMPLWLQTAEMEHAVAIDGDEFRSVWTRFQTSRTDLLTALSAQAQATADGAKADIEAMSADDILTEVEKIALLREWSSVYKEFPVLMEGAQKAHVGYANYEAAYYRLGNYLVDLTKDSASSRQGWTVRNKTIDGVTYNFFVDYGNPMMLLYIQGNTTIEGNTHNEYWSDYRRERSRLLEAIGNGHVNVFVQESRPTPPYKEGDQWIVPSTRKMLLCVRGRNVGDQGDDSDWDAMEDVTEKRDPRIVLAAFAEKLWLVLGSTISGNTYGYCVCKFGGTMPSTSRKGDIWWDADSGSMNFWDGSWYGSNNDALRAACRAVHEALGDYTLTLYTSQANTSHLYDLCCRTISFIDPFSRETVEGDVEVMMYGEAGWELLRESTRGLIENLGKQLRLCVLGGTANGTTAVSGLLTKSNISQLFAQASDTNGKIITEAYMNVKIKDFVTADGVKTMISEAEISADRIKLTGTDDISLAIGSIASAQKQYGPNLLPNSIINETSTAYGFGNRSLRLEAGKKYTLSASGVVPTSLPSNMVLKVYIYRRLQDGDTIESGKVVGVDWAASAACEITANGGAAQTGSVTFEADATCEWHISSYLYDRNHSNGTSGSGGTRTAPVTALWYKVEEGATATPWVAADSDDNGLDNFIVNPLAVSATIENNTDCTASEVTDSVFGRVLQISHNVNGHWQATFTRRDNYELLTGRDATFYVICRDTSNNPEGRIADSSGNQVRKRLCFGYNGGSSTRICVDTYSSQFVDLGNGWRKYYATKKMDVALGTTIGICHTLGTWQVYAVGIVLGGVCPLVAEIMAKNALLSTGIDITTGSIELRADKVKFTSSDGKVTNKIWIDPTTGGLHAVDGEFSGKITATSGIIGDFKIEGTNLTAQSGSLKITPNGVEFRPSNGSVAWLGATDNIIAAFYADMSSAYNYKFACGAQFGATGASNLNAAIDITKGVLSGLIVPVLKITNNITIVCDNNVYSDTDYTKHVRSGGIFLPVGNNDLTFTLPAAPANGTMYSFIKTSDNRSYTIKCSGSDKISVNTKYNNAPTSYTFDQFKRLVIIYFDGQWYGNF